MAKADSIRCCVHCGKRSIQDARAVYCSPACKAQAKKVRRRGYSLKPQPMRYVDATCLSCGKAFKSRPSGCSPNGWVACCSVKCAQRNRQAQARALKPIVVKTMHGHCKQCGKHYQMATSTSVFCSSDCQRSYWRADLDARKCCVCGAEFTPTRTGGRFARACSATCRSEAARRQQRIAKSQRRARIRKVSHEAIDPIAVFMRDKWKCRLCGVRTPKRLRGTYEDTAPELDHIVALADGGAHTWSNVQCACRRCNGAKGAASRGQLGLPFAA